MPTFDELYKYHSFSKAPAAGGLTTGQSVNKAGHTVAAKDVWAFDVPYMFKVNNLSDLTSKSPKLNDLAWVGAEKKYCQFNGTSWTDITSTIATTVLKNADGKDVLKFHKGLLTPLDNSNNAGVTSNGQAYRFFVDGKPVQRWVAATDCIDETGFPSLGYNVIVIKNNTDTLLDGTDFYADYYGGTIFFASGQSTSTKFEISCFEYVGKYVSEELGGNLVDNRGLDTTENDLWGRNVTKTTEFTRVGHDWLSATTLPETWKDDVVSVSDNKAYDVNGNLVSFVETDMLADGSGMFNATLESFSGNLENLVTGTEMFQGASITNLSTSLKSLYYAPKMFRNSKIESFNIELPTLINANSMFEDCSGLTSFTSNLGYLVSGAKMFKNSGLTSFSGATPYLYIGTEMFKNSNIKTVNTAFNALLTGVGMFENTSLNLESVKHISLSLPKINLTSYNDNNEEYFFFKDGYSFNYLKYGWNNKSNTLTAEYEEYKVSGNDIGEITITWKNPYSISLENRLIIVREYFKWLQLKGWTVISNITDDISPSLTNTSDKIWGRVYEVDASEATHKTSDSKNVVIATSDLIYPAVSTFTKDAQYTWVQYDSVNDLIEKLRLTPIA